MGTSLAWWRRSAGARSRDFYFDTYVRGAAPIDFNRFLALVGLPVEHHQETGGGQAWAAGAEPADLCVQSGDGRVDASAAERSGERVGESTEFAAATS